MAATRAKATAKRLNAFGPREQERVGYQELTRKANEERDEARQQLGDARGNIDLLKAEVFDLERLTERQAGYLDRVHEDDMLRDGNHTVTMSRPRRPGPSGVGDELDLDEPDERSHFPMSARAPYKPRKQWWML